MGLRNSPSAERTTDGNSDATDAGSWTRDDRMPLLAVEHECSVLERN